MNASRFAAIAALATLASFGAHADEADGSQFAHSFEGSRLRAEVQAEAARVAATRSFEPAGSRVLAPVASVRDRASVRAEAAQALRAGLIPAGELGG